MATISIPNGTSYASMKSLFESAKSGDTIQFPSNGRFSWNASVIGTTITYHSIKVNGGVTVEGNNSEIWCDASSRNGAMTNNTARIALEVKESNTTINNLTLRGRVTIWIGGSGHKFNKVVVDQSCRHCSAFSDIKYQIINNLYACFRVAWNSSNLTFNYCEAWYADHIGFAVFNSPNGSTGSHSNHYYNYCKAMHCGSGQEQNGTNPWGRGFDFFESPGTMNYFKAYRCCTYDCLQSGYYNEGTYKPQTINGIVEECHAEQNGMRIANANINNTNLPGTSFGMPADIYGDGYYFSGSIQIKNCTSKNNMIGFTCGDGAYVNGFHDEGSYIGGQQGGGSVNNCTFDKTKYIPYVNYNNINAKIKIVDPPGGDRPLVISNWCTIHDQREILPKYYQYLGINDAAIYLINGQQMLNATGIRAKNYKGAAKTGWGTLDIKVNKTGYTVSNAVKGMGGSASGATSSNTKIATFTPIPADLIAMPASGCGSSDTPPPTPTCDEINCGTKQIYDCATKQWVSIPETDERYIARCIDQPPGGGGDEGNPTGHFPLVPKPVLQKGIKAKIYARDFGLGGAGKAYGDTLTGNQGSNSTYRTDALDVDIVTWDSRMKDLTTDVEDPSENKTVIAYTADEEWLKYPVEVKNCGRYKATFRVSTGASNCKILISADDDTESSVDVPFTSADYSKFTNVETYVTIPYIGTTRVIKLEFVGDINISWFELEHIADEGCKELPTDEPTPIDITQRPFNVFNVRSEYGYECNIPAPQYDYGGEGKAYSNVKNGLAGTYRRGYDTIELFEQSIVTSTNEWIEYTLRVSEAGFYYFRVEASNMSDATARIETSIVDSNGTKIHGLFNDAIPISPTAYIKFYAKADTAEKFYLPAGDFVTMRVKFTGEYLFKSISIVSVDTVEGNIVSRPFSSIDIATLPVIIEPWEFDYGGQGISYVDRTEERSFQKPMRDSDVDTVTVSKAGDVAQTIISGTMKGEWVQYTFKNTIEAEFSNVQLEIECSTTDTLSQIMIVFDNEDTTKTKAADGSYINSYKIKPPHTNNFAVLQTLMLPIKVYKGWNVMRLYFDNNISLGTMTFKP